MHETAYRQLPERRHAVGQCLSSCRLCPRQCKIDRLQGEVGFCGLDDKLYCFREMINPTEESCLAPSHQIYFAGCNLACGFCSVAEWNDKPMLIPAIKTDDLPLRIQTRKNQGAINVNLLGGEPSVSLFGILGILQQLPAQTSVVWNSNMYFSEPVRDGLDGLFDVFLADYKCDNRDCCSKMLGVTDYTEVVRSNLIWASGRAQLLVRHVVLPGHLDCCTRPILEWLSGNLPNAIISLREDYIPPLPAGDCPAKYLDFQEHQTVLKLAKHLGLKLVSNDSE